MTAALMGKTRAEFMVESTRQQAIDVLLDQRLFALEPERYDDFRRPSTICRRQGRNSRRCSAGCRRGRSNQPQGTRSPDGGA